MKGIDLSGHTPESLTAFLKQCGVDPAAWPRKTPANLLEEVRKGESYLVLARVARVVRMNVLTPDRKLRLVEIAQQKKGGPRVDARGEPRSPSGKIGMGEIFEMALRREIAEELHLRDEVHFNIGRTEISFESEESRSLPGIRGLYEIFDFICVLTHAGLEMLDGFRNRDGEMEVVDAEDGKTLFFKWVENTP